MLFVVTRSPIKVITSVQRVGNGIEKMGVNGYNVPFVKNGFTIMFLRLNLIFNLVSGGNKVFFTSLISLFFIYKIQSLWWNGMF